ncbi:hypothetical protein [Halorubrum sp. DTA46]|uniref:hypothetical protein n=1 Tax=Halorubrum sp. DTA46 TaxID=3402162 RepID=UPI003AADD867
MARIEVRVPESTKKEWTEYVDDHSGLASLSTLVRLSVASYVREEDVEMGVEEQLISDFSELESQIQELERQTHKVRAGQLDQEDLVDGLSSLLDSYFEPVYKADSDDMFTVASDLPGGDW